VADASSASLSNDMTWEFWIYFRCDNGIAPTYPISKGWCGTSWSYYIEIENQKLGFWKMNPAGTGTCPSGAHVQYESDSSVVPYNTWTHVAIVQSGSAVQFFVNGLPVSNAIISGSAFTGIKSSGRPVLLGTYQNLAGSYVNVPKSNIDDIRIWNTARTQAEIQGLMNTELAGTESGLVAYWKLNESGAGAGISVVNSAIATGAIFNGTTVGTAANLEFNDNTTIVNALPNCNPILWLKADAGVYSDAGITPATNGQPVQQWNDQSGNNYHLSQLTAGVKPTLASTSVNGKPALLFDGDDMLSSLSQINWNSTTNNDIFIVCKSTSPDNMLIESSPSTVANNGAFYIIDNYTAGGYGVTGALKGTNGSFRTFKNSGGFIACTKIYQITQDMNLPGTNAIKIKYNNQFLSDDGGYNAGTPAGGLSNHFLYAGRRSDNTYGLIGNIAEIIAYPSKLSETRAQEVYNYLNQKYFTGTGVAQFNAVPSGITYNNGITNDETWKHSFNSTNSNQIIASVRDYCLDLGTRSDTVYVEANPVQIGTAYAMRRHYTIHTSLNPAGTKRVRLYYSNADFANLQTMVPGLSSHSQLVVTKYDGPNEDGVFNSTGGTVTLIPSAQITTGTAFGERYLEFDVSGFSEFWIHTGSVPLPVDIKHFTANHCLQNACLQWTVGEEKNVSHYEVEKSTDGVHFERIGNVPAVQQSTYAWEDTRPYAGRNFYRLKVLDIDSKYKYSSIQSLDFAEGEWNVQILPTYSESGQYALNSNKDISSVQIYHTNGSLLRTISSPSQLLDLSDLSSGLYFIRVNTPTESDVLKVMR